MGPIGRRKQSKTVFEQVLGYFKLVLKALVAQRVARKAYTGYKWARRMPYILAGVGIAAAVAAVLRKKQQSGGGGETWTPSTPSTATASSATAETSQTSVSTPDASPAPSTPTTPTPTGSPTAVTPAPTAEADGAPESGGDEGEASS